LIALKKIFYSYFELIVWVTGLLWLALMNPSSEAHFSLCIFKWFGFSFCPGCGLGHSISWLFHGELQHSLNAHPLGIFAVVILLFRIFTLLKINFSNLQILKQ
jgi:hypothetical protein